MGEKQMTELLLLSCWSCPHMYTDRHTDTLPPPQGRSWMEARPTPQTGGTIRGAASPCPCLPQDRTHQGLLPGRGGRVQRLLRAAG